MGNPAQIRQLAVGGVAHDLLAHAHHPRRRRRGVVRDHLCDRLGRLLRAPHAAVLDAHGERGCRQTGPHRHRRRGHHRRRRRVLDHDPGPHAGLAAVRSSHDAQLRPRPGEPGDTRRLRRHLRLFDPRPRFGRHRRPSRRVRTTSLHSRRRGSAARRLGGPHLLHPPHRQVDSTARGDRRDRPRPDGRDRRRDRRTKARRKRAYVGRPPGQVGGRAPATSRGRGRQGPRESKADTCNSSPMRNWSGSRPTPIRSSVSPTGPATLSPPDGLLPPCGRAMRPRRSHRHSPKPMRQDRTGP